MTKRTRSSTRARTTRTRKQAPRRPARRRALAASLPSVSNPKLTKAADAFRRIPSDGALLTFTGDFDRSGANTHIQGAVQMPDYHVLSYSNEGSDRGLMLAMRDADRRLVHAVDVPNDAGRPLYHAGGVQRLGDVIAVASESQENFSVVTFVDAQRLVGAGEAVQDRQADPPDEQRCHGRRRHRYHPEWPDEMAGRRVPEGHHRRLSAPEHPRHDAATGNTRVQ